LIDGGRTLQVSRDQQWFSIQVLLQFQRELAGGRRLTGALEAAHHDDAGPILGEVEAVVHRAHEGDQLIVDDADDLLAGDALLYLSSCILSYTALRTRTVRRMHRVERVADGLFLLAMVLMVGICLFITYALATGSASGPSSPVVDPALQR
jgi:hypothetical protein